MALSEQTPNHVSPGQLPQGEALKRNTARRKLKGNIYQTIFMGAIGLALLALLSLLYNVVNEAFGLVAINNRVDPATLSDKDFEDLSAEELGQIILNDE